MHDHQVVSRDEWLVARKEHLAREKEFTRLRDRLSQERRELPWVRVDRAYTFEGPGGGQGLADLFEGRSQLVVYHFMFGPGWEEGCKSCSFWADNFNGVIAHLNQRDVTMVAISSAPLAQLEPFRKRMGWTFTWLSSFGSDFNRDYHVSFSPDASEPGPAEYNYELGDWGDEAPGISVFFRAAGGAVFHTYSCYARGLDMLNSAYHYLDLVPKGRDEAELPYPMAWVRHRDRYEST